ncbi:Putative cyclin-D1-binding protein [Septoria linicola]|uniref:Cyclin-D1-binding protein n=1 Tax=Septoria linicola TaxID=215465 RepID=A0A9Q9AZF5_9PEZI|nr:putative cyclin-D1-binding protein [Septoria linicola]USW55345.1 Putative cyclin-D1-binding protein [Septoria linicola]
MAPSQADNKALQDLINSTLALLKQFASSLNSIDTTTRIENAPNPLHVLRDSAKLLKAHTTKVSLLAINKPFTPSAVTKVLRELTGTCLPAMMSAVQICEQEKSTWGSTMGREVTNRTRRVFKEVENLLQELQSIANGNGQGATNARDSLASTGVVWESCDALIDLEQLGIAGLAVKRAEQYRDTIKDAIAELQEWKEGTDLDTEGVDDALLDSGDEGVDGDADSFDNIFNAANSCPKDRPELKELVDVATGKLKKIVFLYTALGKRRFKTFRAKPSEELGSVDDLDEMLRRLLALQQDVDDIAGGFYELDEDLVNEVLEKCVIESREISQLARLDWTAKEDEFTAWREKWDEALG